jgi:hypothetical protein
LYVPNKPEDPQDKPTFRVTDRRRVTPEGAHEPEQAPASQAETTPEPPPSPETPPPEGDAHGEEFLRIPVADLLRIFIAELQMRALIHTGVIPNPQTHLVAKDLPQAQLAIDCMAALIEQLRSVAAPAEHDQLQQILADLRLTFVREGRG